jgi:putative ABC transport system ATP-binding protein
MIKLENIHRNFQVGDQVVHALDDINLEIEQGEYVSIMGPSGSGKSTLLNLIGMLDHPSSGNYYLNGRNVTELNEFEEAQTRNRNIGFVFQAFHLVPRLTAAQNIELPLILAGMAPDVRQEKVNKVLDDLNLSDRAHHKPEQLSGGQRQRVAIARATISEPSVLLADEPTGNLDQKSGHDVMKTLESLNERGITLLMVTHDIALGNRSRRSITMIDGRIETDTTESHSHAPHQ